MMPTGTPTLSQSPKGFMGFLFCDRPYGLIGRGVRPNMLPVKESRTIFFNTLSSLGYDITGNPGRFFDEDEDLQRTIYAVGATITDIKSDTCRKSSALNIHQGLIGEAHMVVEWSVFDLLNRKSVYKTTTRGYSELQNVSYEGLLLLIEEAFAAAAHNLGADPHFQKLVFYGAAPPTATPQTNDRILDIQAAPITLFDPNEALTIHQRALSRTPVKGRFERLKNSAVMIEAGGGHGSGFFISDQGHILTNAHVTGNSVRVRVVTAGKEEKLIAEVLRINRKRDVALLRLETIPDDLRIQTLPLNPQKATIGADVYAIGAPRLKTLQDTVTRGIVSAHRYDRREKQWYIQADVDIYQGNSGGPLLDEFGNIIGISVAGFKIAPDTLGGLNTFIPINHALEVLDISLQTGGKTNSPLTLAP